MSSRDKRSSDKHRGCCASVSGKCADWYGPNGPVTPRLVSPAARAWVIVRETRPVWRGASRSSDTPTTIGVFCVTMSQDGSGRRTPPRGEQLLQDSPAPPTPPAEPAGRRARRRRPRPGGKVAQARDAADEQSGGLVDRVKARVAAARRQRAATKGPGSHGLLYALCASALVLIIVFAASLVVLFNDPSGRQISLSQLSQLAAGGRVEAATFLDEDSQVVSQLRSTADALKARPVKKGVVDATAVSPSVPGIPDDAITVRTVYPDNGATLNSTITLLQTSGAKVTVDPQSGQARLRAFTTFLLPVLILVNLFGILFVGKGGGGGAIGEVTNFGRVDDGSRTGGSNVTFAGVGGADEAGNEPRAARHD